MDYRRLRSTDTHFRSFTRPTRRRLAVALALAFAAGYTEAATYVVASETELVQAINTANAHAGVDQIHVGVDITLSAALPTITDSLVIDGIGGQRTIRRDDGGSNACSPSATNAFRLIDASADLTLTDLMLTGGCNLVDQGGAVRVQGASLEVRHSTVSGNQTFVANEGYPYRYGQGGIGAGVAVLYGALTIADSVISDNAAHGVLAVGGGAALFLGSGVRVERSVITGNQSIGLGPFGGGIYALGDAATRTLIVTDSIFANNYANGDYALGGALMSQSNTTVSNSQFVGNRAGGSIHARGAGIDVEGPPGTKMTILIDGSTIANNTVTGEHGWGAGLRLAGGGGEIRLTSSSVIDNAIRTTGTAHGGGMWIESADMTIVGATVSGNLAGGGIVQSEGGGIGILSEAPNAMALAVYNSTIAANGAPGGSVGGIWMSRENTASVSPTLDLESTIVSGNTGHGEPDEIGRFAPTATAPIIVVNHSLVQGAVDAGAGTYTPDASTMALAGKDPLLLPLANNGGPTLTQAVAAGSPALDQGSNVLSLLFDQRGSGHPRAFGTTTDVGAYERKR